MHWKYALAGLCPLLNENLEFLRFLHLDLGLLWQKADTSEDVPNPRKYMPHKIKEMYVY
jgi:hypothetical protein